MSTDAGIPWRQVVKPAGGIPAEDLDPDATAGTTVLVPWTTTTTADGPTLMWDDDDNLMMIEVPR